MEQQWQPGVAHDPAGGAPQAVLNALGEVVAFNPAWEKLGIGRDFSHAGWGGPAVSRGMKMLLEGREENLRFSFESGGRRLRLTAQRLGVGASCLLTVEIADVTDRLEEERRLREKTRGLAALLDRIPDPAYVADVGGRFLWANAAAVEKFGDRAPTPPELERRALEWGETCAFEHEVSGRRFQVRLEARRSPDDRGLIAVWRDMTEMLRLQEELAQTRRAEAVGRVACGLARDLGGLLTAITGYAEIVAHGLGSGHVRAGEVREIARAAERAFALIRRLLKMDKPMPAAPEVFDLNGVLAECAPMLGRLVRHDMRICVQRSAETASVFADRPQIEQLLTNFALEARESPAPNTSVTIRTTLVRVEDEFDRRHLNLAVGTYAQVELSADGDASMDVRALSRVLEPLAAGSPGLGVAGAQRAVQKAGGQISIDARARGTRLRLWLPLAEEPSPAAPQRGTENILLVEDDAEIRLMLKRVLEGCGYRVAEAESAESALELENRFDLLLTEAILPGMNGGQLARRLQRARPGMRVVYISGHSQSSVIRHGVPVDDDRFVSKPFKTDALLSSVRVALS